MLSKEFLNKTKHLTKPASYIECNQIDKDILFDELLKYQQTAMISKCIRFNLIFEDSGSDKEDWHEDYYLKKSDQNFNGYHKRMCELLNAKFSRRVSYQFVINDLETMSIPFRNWFVKFSDSIHEHCGKLGGFAYSAIFLGNYKKTTFGIHVDDEFVFHVPIVGKKQMQLWDLDTSKVTTKVLASPPSDGLVIEAEPGTCLFWTPNYHHVSSSDSNDLVVSIANSYKMGVCVPSNWEVIRRRFFWMLKDYLTGKGSVDDVLECSQHALWMDEIKRQFATGNQIFQKRQSKAPVFSSKNDILKQLEQEAWPYLKVQVLNLESSNQTQKRISLSLVTEEQPKWYSLNDETQLCLHGHIFDKGREILDILNMFQNSRGRLSMKTNDFLTNEALVWLHKVRAISAEAY